MSKIVRTASWVSSTLLLVAACALWRLAFTVPALDPHPLPPNLVPLTAVEGQRLLAEAARADYPVLATMFQAQRRPAYCGVASAVIVVNAMRPASRRVSQAAFFADLATELSVTFAGMTLDELGQLLRRHGAHVETVHAADSTIDAFRAQARENLSRPGDYVLVNYQRAALGQGEGGHISPLAAYSAATDRFLILDVAAYRYPPVWVSTTELWNAINTMDSTSRQTRGFAIVRDGAAPL
jgi:hypothetical protein